MPFSNPRAREDDVVPLNWDTRSSVPIGTHFIAARGNDKLLYELAYALEKARP